MGSGASSTRRSRRWSGLSSLLPARAREELAELVACRLDGVVSALGVVFLLVVLGQTIARDGSTLAFALLVAGWLLWIAFAAEFIARLVIAPSTSRFLRSNWWQLVFLAVPFLRFARVLAAVRLGRAGVVVSSAVRSSRSTRGLLASRIGWLAMLTLIVALAASQLLYVLASPDSYAQALHAATFAVLTGEPIGIDGTPPRVIELVLAAYSVVVFASLAAALGAYFLRRDREPAAHEVDAGSTRAERRRT